MSIKKTISMPDYVAKAAKEKSKKRFGGNFSNYLQWLICSDNEEEIKKLLDEAQKNKPTKNSHVYKAEYASECPVCRRAIKPGDRICSAVFLDGHDQFVHEKCCRE